MRSQLPRREFFVRAATAGCLGAASGLFADADSQVEAADPKPSSLTITKVETFALKHKLAKAIGPSVSQSNERDALLVKISTDSGLVGWGETADVGGTRGIIEGASVGLLTGVLSSLLVWYATK